MSLDYGRKSVAMFWDHGKITWCDGVLVLRDTDNRNKIWLAPFTLETTFLPHSKTVARYNRNILFMIEKERVQDVNQRMIVIPSKF